MRFILIAIMCFSSTSLVSQDMYHTELLEYLFQEFEVENPSYLITNTETQNRNQRYSYGNNVLTDSDISNFNFSNTTNVQVASPGTNSWDTGFGYRNQNTINEDDIVLITFWAKQNGSTEIFLFAEDAVNYEKEFYFSISLSPDWTQYFIAFKANKAYSVERMSMGFHNASIAQDFDIGGYTALNFGKEYKLTDLPSTFGPGTYGGSASDAEWRPLAENRIENIRKSNLGITVVDLAGNPIKDAEVKIEMEEHEFGFGSALVSCRFPGNRCYDETYVSKITDLDGQGHGFNVGVTENALKWDGWEEEWLGTPEETANAIQWLTDNSITMRGHTLFWPGFDKMPDDITANRTDLAYLRTRIKERLEDMLTHPTLSKQLEDWDVLNEITTNRDFENTFKDDPNFVTGREIYKEIIELAKEINPEIPLYVNDYVVLSGGGSSSTVTNRYKSYLNELVDNDVPFDGIGFQCHIGSQLTSILTLQQNLDEFYQRYGKRMKITEFDINENVDEELQGTYMSDFLTMIFSHPGVDAFITWGFWDGNHWKGNAPFFNLDWTLKPSGQAFNDKVFNEWWTNETSISDPAGKVNFRPFKGTHNITVTKDGKSKVSQVLLSDDKNIQIILEDVSANANLDTSKFLIQPNPITQGSTSITFPDNILKADLEVLDIQGKTVLELSDVLSKQKIKLDLISGVYFMNIITDEGRVVKKINLIN